METVLRALVVAVLLLSIAGTCWCATRLVRRSGLGCHRTLAVAFTVSVNVGALAVLGWMSTLHHPMWARAVLILTNGAVAATCTALARPTAAPDNDARWRHPGPAVIAVACGAGVLALLVLIQVILYTPTGYDSMAYHLPKLAHLIDTGSVQPFAAHRSLLSETPWGYTYLTYLWWLVLGEHSFRYVGIVQFAGFMASLAVLWQMVADLARRASVDGARRARTTASAVVFVALLLSPMLLVQSASSRNDLVATAACLLLVRGAVYLLVRPLRAANVATAALLCAFGGAGVLAVKPNLLIQALVFVVLLAAWTGLHVWRDRRTIVPDEEVTSPSPRRSVVVLLAVAAVVLSLPFVQASVSNLRMYDSITGPGSDQVLGERPGVSDAVCRASMSLAWEGRVADVTPNVLAALLSPISELEQDTLRSVADVCGPRIVSWANNLTPNADPFDPGGTDGNEDWQSSPLQLHAFFAVVIGLAVAAVRSLVRRRRVSAPTRVLTCAVVALLVAQASMPWQYYSNSRFLLPMWLVIDATALLVVAEAVARIVERRGPVVSHRVRIGAAVVLVSLVTVQVGWMLATNVHRPLPPAAIWDEQPRGADWSTYMRASLGVPPTEAIEGVINLALARDCHVVGVASDFLWSFPLWLATRREGIRIVEVDVDNPSAAFEPPADQRGVCAFIGADDDRSFELSDASAMVIAPGWVVW